MKAIVIFKSKTGFTKRYAEWIAEALSCKAVPAESAMEIDLSAYDAVVFGGWFFAGSVQGYKEFKSKLTAFKGKKAVFITGAMSAESPAAMQAMDAAFPGEERKNTGVFYMQGGLDYSHMGFMHKTMMKTMSFMMKQKNGADSSEYKTISQSFDASDKSAIRPLVDYMDS